MRINTFFGSVAAGALLAVPGAALAQTAFPASNPNAAEWALIGLTPDLVAAGNGGAGVYVGVFDGYADCRHTDLAGRCSNYQIPGARYRLYSNHGTHVSGTVAGSKYGVATSAFILNYAVFDDRKYVATGTKLIDAWKAAAGLGGSVASMSFGCTGTALCFTADEVRAMGGAQLSGMLFVKAAGNDGRNLANETIAVTQAEAQSALSRLILVGSVNASGAISSFSNRAGDGCLVYSGATTCSSVNQWKYHFLVAPGEAIYATLPAQKYGSMSGTSMATPVVSGAVALLESRWPTLKSQPASVASLLFTTATDLGAPGLDNVYGWGLLNVGAAFQNQGYTAAISPTGGETQVSGASMTGSPTLTGLTAVLGGVTAYDAFGRDYQLSDVSNFTVRSDIRTLWSPAGARMLNRGGQSAWTGAFFNGGDQAKAWASFGPTGFHLTGGDLDQSLRLGVDMPLGEGALQMRLTGAGDTRADLAADEALRPLSFFASSDLLKQSALVGYSRQVAGGKLMMFGAASGGGAVQARVERSEFAGNPGLDEELDLALQGERSPLRQAAFGVGYWTQPSETAVVGVTVSAYSQKNGFYDLATDLGLFDRPTHVLNLGLAGSRDMGAWDLFGSVETSFVRPPSASGPIQFTSAVLASAEVGARRSNILIHGDGKADALSVSLVSAPQAIAGSLNLDYLERTEDGLGRQSVNRSVPLSQLSDRTLRLETAYEVSAGERWRAGLAGGADLGGAAEYEVVGRWNWSF